MMLENPKALFVGIGAEAWILETRMPNNSREQRKLWKGTLPIYLPTLKAFDDVSYWDLSHLFIL